MDREKREGMKRHFDDFFSFLGIFAAEDGRYPNSGSRYSGLFEVGNDFFLIILIVCS